MDAQSTAGAALITQAVVVGSFGGVGLVLGYMFSKRGPIIFPIYAAILFVAALVISQYPGLSFLPRFSALMLSMFIATAMAMVAVVYNTQRVKRLRAKRGLPPVEGRTPWWGAPFVVASVAAASAGVAILIR